MVMSKIELFSFLVFVSAIAETSGCYCAPPWYNRRLSYCKADFTIRGLVHEYEGVEKPRGSIYLHKKYRIYPEKFYRHLNVDFKSFHLYTPNHHSLCEKKLKVNASYIFNGKIVYDQYIINRCEWNQRWNFVPKWVKHVLPFFYNFC